jgi:hypothetical protein
MHNKIIDINGMEMRAGIHSQEASNVENSSLSNAE